MRECELAQEHEDWRVREDALFELARQQPKRGEQVAFQSIRETAHESVMWYALYAAWRYVYDGGATIDRRTLGTVGDMATDRRNRSIVRDLAMMILCQVNGRGLQALLIRIATEDPEPSVHEQAYVALLRLGYAPAKRFLLEHVREYPEHVSYAHDLWRHRARFRWRPSEERELREMMERYHERFRRRLYDRRWRLRMRAAAVRWLTWLAEDGFEFAPKDVQQGRKLARLCGKDERKDLYFRLRHFEQQKRDRKAKVRTPRR